MQWSVGVILPSDRWCCRVQPRPHRFPVCWPRPLLAAERRRLQPQRGLFSLSIILALTSVLSDINSDTSLVFVSIYLLSVLLLSAFLHLCSIVVSHKQQTVVLVLLFSQGDNPC